MIDVVVAHKLRRGVLADPGKVQALCQEIEAHLAGDASATWSAFEWFEAGFNLNTLMQEFPESRAKREAKKRMRLARARKAENGGDAARAAAVMAALELHPELEKKSAKLLPSVNTHLKDAGRAEMSKGTLKKILYRRRLNGDNK
jgi:hypothetical protein